MLKLYLTLRYLLHPLWCEKTHMTVLSVSYELDNTFVLRAFHNPSDRENMVHVIFGSLLLNRNNTIVFAQHVIHIYSNFSFYWSVNIWKILSLNHPCQVPAIQCGPHKWAAPDTPLLHPPCLHLLRVPNRQVWSSLAQKEPGRKKNLPPQRPPQSLSKCVLPHVLAMWPKDSHVREQEKRAVFQQVVASSA